MNILIEKLRQIVIERRKENATDDIIINALKEELHYVVLNFVYNNRSYSHLVMYGGTLLRIAHGLPRMSIDLDFQTDKKFNFEKFSEDLVAHIKATYGIEISIINKTERLTETDYMVINFPDILPELNIKGHGRPTVLKIRFDINPFSTTVDFSTETIPVSKDTYAFSIKTYPIGTLMASKIAAVLLRGPRGIGTEVVDCKPRDIYDLMWYMEKKIIPNIEYLKAIHARAKKILTAQNVLEVFDVLSVHVSNLDDSLFKHDLAPLFYSPIEYERWHHDWRQRLIQLRNAYEIYKIKKLTTIWTGKEFSTGNRHFQYIFSTEEPGVQIIFTYILSEYWYLFSDFKISLEHRRNDLKHSITDLNELDHAYIGLFYTKTEDYIRRNNHMVLRPEFTTKIIRATADNLNVKKEIFLDRRLLEKTSLEDLF